jgi:hypothetical protein
MTMSNLNLRIKAAKALASAAAEKVYANNFDDTMSYYDEARMIALEAAELHEYIESWNDAFTAASLLSTPISMIISERRKLEELDMYMSAYRSMMSSIQDEAHHTLMSSPSFTKVKRKRVKK